MYSFSQNVLNHQLLHILTNLLLYVPGVKSLRNLRFRKSQRVIAQKDETVALEWAKKITEKALSYQVSIQDADILELGPGAFFGVAALLTMKGAHSVTGVDVSEFIDLKVTEQFRPFIEKAEDMDWITQKQSFSAKEVARRLNYIILRNGEQFPVESNSYDLIYSFHVGEHLRAPRQVLAEIHRVLKPGGLCIHTIDLHDHIRANRNDNWLQFLYYETPTWELMTSNRGCWTNRLRSPQWQELFKKHFEVLEFEEKSEPISPHFNVSKLAEPFKHYDLKTLSIGCVKVVARKRLTEGMYPNSAVENSPLR